MKNAITRGISLLIAIAIIFIPIQIPSKITANAAEGRLYNQNDSQWKNVKFTKYATSGNDMYTSGCGIFSFCNAIYALNGNKPDAVEVATWAVNNGSYQPGNGGVYRQAFYKKIQSAYGEKFNFKIDGQYYGKVTDARLINHLKNGGVAAIHVYDHFMAITGYNASNNTYHVIESAVYSGRGLQADSWVSASKMSSGNTNVDWYALISNTDIIPSTPRIENARISKITNTGYIVQCEVYDEVNSVTRVAFPTWTTNTDSSGNSQDDIVWADGTISGSTATFEVKISDHNNELGYYRTHIYCYNSTGASSSVALPDVFVEQTEPSIYNVKITSQTSTSYTIQCEVEDIESGIDRVQFPTWTTSNGQDDLISDWGTSESVRGSIEGNIVTYTVNISDHNNELGEYESHIYAYDKSGNYSAFGFKVLIENNPPTISDVKIINQTSTSYTVQCKVSDSESLIDRVQFPTWTTENGQDDIAENWGSNEKVKGTLNDDIATFTVNITDHNNEVGEYNTHIYAYDKCGNYTTFGVIVNLGVYKLSVDPNGGTYDNTTLLVVKEHILKYGYSYWGKIGEGEYGNATRNGYTLTGYYSEPNGGTKVYDSNGIAMDTEYFTNLTFFGDGDLTVYAQWEVIKGDVNADNSFNVADTVLLQKWLLAVPDTELTNWQAADLCKDGKLDAFDMIEMRKLLVQNNSLSAQ